MAEALPLASSSKWFTDPRTPDRRMKVAWHPEAGVVVVSLWTRDQCTATFRLPVESAADLMHLLVDAVADDQAPPRPRPRPAAPSVRERLARTFGRSRRRNRVASVIPLRRSR
jgi:hypothetical protein